MVTQLACSCHVGRMLGRNGAQERVVAESGPSILGPIAIHFCQNGIVEGEPGKGAAGLRRGRRERGNRLRAALAEKNGR